jgi:hypothetical protein
LLSRILGEPLLCHTLAQLIGEKNPVTVSRPLRSLEVFMSANGNAQNLQSALTAIIREVMDGEMQTLRNQLETTGKQLTERLDTVTEKLRQSLDESRTELRAQIRAAADAIEQERKARQGETSRQAAQVKKLETQVEESSTSLGNRITAEQQDVKEELARLQSTLDQHQTELKSRLSESRKISTLLAGLAQSMAASDYEPAAAPEIKPAAKATSAAAPKPTPPPKATVQPKAAPGPKAAPEPGSGAKPTNAPAPPPPAKPQKADPVQAKLDENPFVDGDSGKKPDIKADKKQDLSDDIVDLEPLPKQPKASPAQQAQASSRGKPEGKKSDDSLPGSDDLMSHLDQMFNL